MKNKAKKLLILFLTSLTLGSGFVGCASTEEDTVNRSSLPWNRPERWEGGGGMGSYLPQNQGYR